MDPQSIAQTFITQYYQMFDTNRAALGSLYRPESVMWFEGTCTQGATAIDKKLTGLPFTTVTHVVTTTDAGMTVDGGLIVFVVGQLKTDNDQPHGFSQTFYLKEYNGSLFVMNDMFRLALHHQ